MDWILNFEPSTRFPVHTRGNVSEVFPDPITPLSATTGFLQNFEDGYRDAFVAAKVWDESIYEGEVRFALMGCLGGYVYINMSYLRVFAVRVPGYTPELLDMSYGVDSSVAPYENERQDWHEDRARTAEVQRWIDEEVFGAADLRHFDAERRTVLAERDRRPDLAASSDAELVDRIRSLNPGLRTVFQMHAEASLKAGFALGGVVAAATAAGRPELAFELIGGVGDVDSTGPTVLLARIAELVRASPALTAAFDAGVERVLERVDGMGPEADRFRAELEKVVHDWGFRGPGEWELRRDTWETDPTLAMRLVDRMRQPGGAVDPEAKMAAAAGKRERAYRELTQTMDAEARRQLDDVVKAAATWVRARERSRTTSAMLLHEQRVAAHELGRRGAERGSLKEPLHIYMLTAEELDDWVADSFAFTGILAEREQTYLSLFDFVPPFMVTGPVPAHESWARLSQRPEPQGSDDKVLVGAAGSPGTVVGRARVVRSATEVDELEPGDILVASVTDPSWTPLFLTAAGVVTEVGGTFSHGPIVCRELGTPCVVAVEDACRRIPDGARIQVDGSSGDVTVLER
jgi:rifampicin phosphotransferase